jgi:hypothetical protein
MNIDLATIIQNGGPAGFALLFAWIWLRTENELKEFRRESDEKIKAIQEKLDAKTQENTDIYKEIIRKAGGSV